MEWNTPWSLMVQVDNLQWTRTGTLVLASKGDLASGNWWELYLHMTANTKGDAGVQLSQLCFARHSAFNNVGNGICTSAYGRGHHAERLQLQHRRDGQRDGRERNVQHDIGAGHLCQRVR